MLSNKEITASVRRTQVSDIAFPAGFHKAKGVYFEDIEGKRYMDFTSGYGVVNIGWQHPVMIQSIKKQLDKSTYAPPWMPNEESAYLGEKLISLIGVPDLICMRASGGADANEIILKALYAYDQGDVLTFSRSYHGGTHATIGMSDKDNFKFPMVKEEYRTYKIQAPYCLRCAWGQKPESCIKNCALAIGEVLETNKKIKTFFAEPVLGSSGVIVPPAGYFSIVNEICRDKGVNLVFDEVLTGFGRTGKMFAYESFNAEIEGITLAKGFSSGYAAIGAAMLKNKMLEPFRKYDDVSSTFAWNPMACQVALTNIQIIENEKLAENAAVMGNYLTENIKEILEKYGTAQLGEVRSCGLMIGVEWINNQSEKLPNSRICMKFLLRMASKGLIWCSSWDYNTMIALPPLSISMEECDIALDIIEETAKESFR